MRKFICMTIAVLMILTIFAGCQSGDPTSTGPNNATSTTSATTKATSSSEQEPGEKVRNPLDISIAWELIQGINDDDLGRYIQETFNMNIKPIAADGEQLNLMAVSGTLPDVFVSHIGTAGFNTFVREGFVRDIPEELLNEYPTVKEYTERHEMGMLHREMTGKLYGIPKSTNSHLPKAAMEAAIYYREDWRKELGIKVPETVDEFYTMLEAFAFKEGVYGMSGWIWQTHLIPWVDMYNWVKEDGVWIPGYVSDNMIPALEFYGKMYKEKILDPEYGVAPSRDMFFQGKIGAMVHNASTYWLWNNLMVGFQGANQELDPMEVVKLLPPLQGYKDGKPKWPKAVDSGMIMINAKASDEKVDRILDFFEWNLSDEGRDMRHYGFLDIDYIIKDGKAVSILPYRTGEYARQVTLAQKYTSVNIFNLLSWEGPPATEPLNPILPIQIDELNRQFQQVTHGPAAVSVSVLVNNIQTPAKDMSTVNAADAETEFNRIISTNDPAAEFEIIRKKWLEIDGLQMVIDEVNQIIKAQGIE